MSSWYQIPSFPPLSLSVVSISTTRWAFAVLLSANLAILIHYKFSHIFLNSLISIQDINSNFYKSSLVYGLRWMTVNRVSNGANNLSASLALAKIHVFNWVILCCLCFTSDSKPDSIRPTILSLLHTSYYATEPRAVRKRRFKWLAANYTLISLDPLCNEYGITSKSTLLTYRFQSLVVSTSYTTWLLYPSLMIQWKYSPGRTIYWCCTTPSPIAFH
jgi:hypothetical protein